MTITLEVGKITMQYLNGTTMEGVVLTRYGNTMRVAVKDGEDAAQFTCVNGTWISEDCEPVQIHFEWHRRKPSQPVTEEDCICPKELAARLIHVPLSGDVEETGSQFGTVPLFLEASRRHSDNSGTKVS